MKFDVASRRARQGAALALMVGLLLGASAGHAADEDNSVKTGEGGRLLRYSSTQRWVELSSEERQGLERLRDHTLKAASIEAGVQACRRALEAMGYGTVEQDNEFGLLLAYKHESLIGDARKSLRGLWMSKLPMPSKPDHQSTEIRISLRAPGEPLALKLRARIVTTVWDNHGDARTKIDTDAALYQDLFQRVDQALASP